MMLKTVVRVLGTCLTGLLPVAFLLLGVSGAQAAGTVGSGTPVSCTEAALDTALVGGGAVTFNCGAAPVTVVVTTTKALSVTTTIDGNHLITLSGGNLIGVISTTAALTVQNLTIAEGNSKFPGAAISMSSAVPLTITNSSFVNNSAGGNGGAVSYSGGDTLTISGSTFSGNTARGFTGGALYIEGRATITNSTFYGNNAGVDGGAIYMNTGHLDLVNVTVAGNTAAGEAGGIYENSDSSSSYNSIFANNTPTNCDTTGYAFERADSSYNLSSDASCRLGGVGNMHSTNPLLGPLANNGGYTQTMALLAGSPALNAGNPATPGGGGATCLAVDQVGTNRPQGAACDIGAFEVPVGGTPVAAIPTLSEWAMILLATLLVSLGLLTIRRRAG